MGQDSPVKRVPDGRGRISCSPWQSKVCGGEAWQGRSCRAVRREVGSGRSQLCLGSQVKWLAPAVPTASTMTVHASLEGL